MVTDAGEGVDRTKGLASFLAIVRFMGTQLQLLEARRCSAANLLANLAWAINVFHLRECTSWAFSAAGDVEGSTAVLTDFCPGFLPKTVKDPVGSILSNQLQTALSLDIPCDIKICIRSDSTLSTYPTKKSAEQGLKSTDKKNMLHHFQDAHKSYVIDQCVWNGATIANILSELPKDLETIATFDVTIVVCNINKPTGKKVAPVYSPSSDQGLEVMKLCMELRKHKRALIVIGGAGYQWKLPPPEAIEWDRMVAQFIGIAQSCGVMAVDGQKYYDRMKSAPDGIHFATEYETIGIIVEMLQDGINALYGARPQGTFARAQRLTGIVEPSESSGPPFAVAPSVSTEELEAAAAIQAVDDQLMADAANFGGFKTATPEQQERFNVYQATQASMASVSAGPASASASAPVPTPTLPASEVFYKIERRPFYDYPTMQEMREAPETPPRKRFSVPRLKAPRRLPPAPPPPPPATPPVLSEFQNLAQMQVTLANHFSQQQQQRK
jgi:hypothetical protein